MLRRSHVPRMRRRAKRDLGQARGGHELVARRVEKDAAVGERVGPKIDHAAARIVGDEPRLAPRPALVAGHDGAHVE